MLVEMLAVIDGSLRGFTAAVSVASFHSRLGFQSICTFLTCNLKVLAIVNILVVVWVLSVAVGFLSACMAPRESVCIIVFLFVECVVVLSKLPLVLV